MEGQDCQQQPRMILAHKHFLLTHSDVLDIEKVRLRQEVLDSVVADDVAPLYETLAASSVLDLDQSVFDSMRAKIDDQLKKLDVNFGGDFSSVISARTHPIEAFSITYYFVGFDLGFLLMVFNLFWFDLIFSISDKISI